MQSSTTTTTIQVVTTTPGVIATPLTTGTALQTATATTLVTKKLKPVATKAPKRVKMIASWSMILNATLGMFVFGYILSVMNTVQSFLSAVVFKWDDSESKKYTSLFNSLVTVGAGIGAFAGGNFAKLFGRRRSLMATDIVTAIGVVFTLFPNVATILIGRLICGFCVGVNSAIVPTYVNEVAPLKAKGTAGSYNQLQVTIGSLIAFCLGFGVPEYEGKEDDESVKHNSFWRFMLAFPIIIVFIRFVILLLIFRHETPTYLLSKNRRDDAKVALSKIYYPAAAEEELQVLEASLAQSQTQGKVKLASLFNKKWRLRFFLGCFIGFLQQMTGVNALIFYSTQIFEKSSSGTGNRAVLYTALFAVFNLLATLASGLVLKKFGRKTILIIGDIAISAVLIGVAALGFTHQDSKITVPIFVYIVFFGLSMGPIVWVYISEILPDIGIGIAILFNWLGAFIMAQFYQDFSEAVGISSSFLYFAGFCLLSLFVLVFMVKETRNLTPQQIDELYTKGKVEKPATATVIAVPQTKVEEPTEIVKEVKLDLEKQVSSPSSDENSDKNTEMEGTVTNLPQIAA